jgi:hypothetical protein
MLNYVLNKNATKSRQKRSREVQHMGLKRNSYRVLVGKPQRKSSLGRPTCRCKDIFRTDLKEMGCKGVDWIDLAQDRDKWWDL